MSNWRTANPTEVRLKQATEVLLFNHYNLLEFVLDTEQPRLSKSIDELLIESVGFSSSEQTLIRVAIELWSDELCCGINSLLHNLNQSDFEQVMKTFVFLGPKPTAAVPRPDRQLKLDSL